MIRITRTRVVTAASALALAVSATITTITNTSAYAADTLLCCDQAVDTNNPAAQNFAGQFGVDLSRTVGEVGLHCRPVGSAGGAGSCSAASVLCANNNFGGVLATGCRPGDADM
ncbi:hydrophobin family protein [Streptomyces sp. NPDC049555]|uniref:hydrophobin family protein n=1 Tax=Streptomyces sp. NPDC049555 TaxID=3154930 RepID=UPI00343F2660